MGARALKINMSNPGEKTMGPITFLPCDLDSRV